MTKIFQISCVVFSLLALNKTILTAQVETKIISKLIGNTLVFNNGDSLRLVSLTKPDYQLVILVFHAEEDTIGMDPGLSINGRWRAIHLFKLFQEINFKGYFTTPFRNNILTLQPLIDSKNSKTVYYDQADLQTLTESIKKLFPSPVMVMVHPETVALVFKQLTQQDYPFALQGNLSEKLILIQRSKKNTSIWNEFNYSIR